MELCFSFVCLVGLFCEEKIGASDSLRPLFFLWHPKLVPISVTVIQFISLGLRTSLGLFSFVCDIKQNLYSSFLYALCMEKQKRHGRKWN